MIARVVGVPFSPLGAPLAPELGWADEDLHNAAFDAAEFVDATLAYGWKPLAILDREGAPVSLMLVPGGGSHTEKQNRAFLAPQESAALASRATLMIAVE